MISYLKRKVILLNESLIWYRKNTLSWRLNKVILEKTLKQFPLLKFSFIFGLSFFFYIRFLYYKTNIFTIYNLTMPNCISFKLLLTDISQKYYLLNVKSKSVKSSSAKYALTHGNYAMWFLIVNYVKKNTSQV